MPLAVTEEPPVLETVPPPVAVEDVTLEIELVMTVGNPAEVVK